MDQRPKLLPQSFFRVSGPPQRTATVDRNGQRLDGPWTLLPEGPFPDELLSALVMHLSYLAPDGTTGAGDAASLSAIHLALRRPSPREH
ncbi:hypothetical protein AWC13_21410 [Mycobacterium kubicae]|nr:hypothetical protein AWC13_21410 [Mycobacterium kubicae]